MFIEEGMAAGKWRPAVYVLGYAWFVVYWFVLKCAEGTI
jgi:hypothetical protein